MAILNIELLKKIIDTIPDDYILEYDKGTTTVPIKDCIEIDISGRRLIFK